MEDTTKEKFIISAILGYILAACVAECIPALLAIVILSTSLVVAVAVAPKPKVERTKKIHPLYTDWDECYRISQNW
jgi:hypothetical protein